MSTARTAQSKSRRFLLVEWHMKTYKQPIVFGLCFRVGFTGFVLLFLLFYQSKLFGSLLVYFSFTCLLQRVHLLSPDAFRAVC